MEQSVLNDFIDVVNEQKLNIYGINLYQNGKKSVSHRWRSNDRECIYSGSKTFTSVAIGICRDEKLLDLDDEMMDFFPEYRDLMSDGTETVTIRDLLHMASGKNVFWFGNEEAGKIDYHDYMKDFVALPMSWKAGEKFSYSNACTYALSRIVHKVTGMDLREFLIPKLFTPMGIFNPQWQRCPIGFSVGASGLYLRTEEYSRLGIMMLNHGVYGDTRIVSEGYVREMYSDLIDNSAEVSIENKNGYGYQIWRSLHPGSYRADGMYMQISMVLPDKEAVVTFTSHEETKSEEIFTAVRERIITKL